MTRFALFLMPWLLIALSAQADVAGSRDHPLISRYEGSQIVRYDQREYDEFQLMNGRAAGNPRSAGEVDPALHLEGKVTRISYELPAGVATLAVLRNYQQALEKAGFREIFACSNAECGGRDFNHSVVPYWSGFAENYEDQRYYAGKLSRPEGDVYAAVYVVRNLSEGGPTHNRIYTQLDVVEVAPMKEEMVSVNADVMARSIADTGRVTLYGIHFDTDKADIKPDSRPTIDQIGQLMTRLPNLKLVIVGHTDNQGSLEYNMDLSTRRAKAVEAALIESYGIAPSRLSAWGAGYLAPVASNQTEEGRAKNRRVELVEQ
jgi:outer membrane protein OmpA-like peptidoglycan-associated protein